MIDAIALCGKKKPCAAWLEFKRIRRKECIHRGAWSRRGRAMHAPGTTIL